MARYLVTGGAGFIGSHIVHGLLARGDEVRVLDDLSTGRADNVPSEADLIIGDLTDPDARRRALDGVQGVFHHAAKISVPESVEQPHAYELVNAAATVALFEDAVRAGVRRVVFASTSAVYGDAPMLPKREDQAPDPLSPYAITKLTGERYAAFFTRYRGLEVTALRYFNVYGPRQDPGSAYAAVIPKWASSLAAGRSLVVFGDGTQSRDFVHVEDVVRANLGAMASPVAPGRVYNVAAGRTVTLLELIATLEMILGRAPQVDFAPPRAGDVLHSGAAIDRARTDLDYEPLVSLEAGLRATLAWFGVSGAA